jgi:acetyltransferase-like isoleucine patch superfamily enzyme
MGDYPIVGAGSVVTRDIPSTIFAEGNPYKEIKNL